MKLGSVEIQNMIVVKCHCERPMLFTLDASRKCIQIIRFIQCTYNVSFFVHYSFNLEPHRNFLQRKKDSTQDCAQIFTSICILGTSLRTPSIRIFSCHWYLPIETNSKFLFKARHSPRCPNSERSHNPKGDSQTIQQQAANLTVDHVQRTIQRFPDSDATCSQFPARME